MTGNLLVTPEKMTETAQEFSSKASEVQSLTNNMLDTVNNLKTTWAGEANTAYDSQFKQLEDDMERFYKMIMEHSSDLEQMAENYKSAETANQSTASSLPGDAIS